MFCSLSGGDQLECEGHAVHAIAQARRLGAVIEDVPEMTAAPAAVNSGSHHAEGRVFGGSDSPFQRRPEARPARTAVVLRGRGEQVQVAAHASEVATPFFMEQRAREWPLGCAHAQHGKLIWSQ